MQVIGGNYEGQASQEVGHFLDAARLTVDRGYCRRVI